MREAGRDGLVHGLQAADIRHVPNLNNMAEEGDREIEGLKDATHF